LGHELPSRQVRTESDLQIITDIRLWLPYPSTDWSALYFKLKFALVEIALCDESRLALFSQILCSSDIAWDWLIQLICINIGVPSWLFTYDN
jgi:hypothetical protein